MGGYLHSHTEFRTLMVRTYTDLSMKRWTFTLSKFDEPFGVRFYFENFREPESVSVKVILLVGHDKTLHTMVTSVSTKR